MKKWLQNTFGHLNRRLEIVVGSPFPLYFLAGVLAANLISDGISSWVEQIYGVSVLHLSGIKILTGMVIFLLALLFFSFSNLGRWLSRLTGKGNVKTEDSPPVKRGLIALVSKGSSIHTSQAMKYHFETESDPQKRLQHCWLLVGPGDDAMAPGVAANRLKTEYDLLGVKVHLMELNDADDPGLVFHAVQSIIREAQWKHGLFPKDLIADFTAGTKCMTAGVVLACVDSGLQVQFMKSDTTDEYGRTLEFATSSPRLVNIDFYLHQPGEENQL